MRTRLTLPDHRGDLSDEDGVDEERDDEEDEDRDDEDDEDGDGLGPSPRALAVAGTVVVAVIVAVLLLVGVRGSPWTGVDDPQGEPVVERFSPPVPLAVDSGFVRTRVLADGELLVDHWIRSAAPLFSLTLVRPNTPGLDEARVVARSVVVVEDGEPGAAPRRLAGPRVRLDLLAAHRVHVSYRLSGVLARSTPTARRAVLQAIALQVRQPGRPPRLTYVVDGADVLEMACAGRIPGSVPVPCGSVQGGRWSVQLPRARYLDRVVAQVDLRMGGPDQAPSGGPVRDHGRRATVGLSSPGIGTPARKSAS